MNSQSEKIEITVNTLLYIIKKLNGSGDFHKVFKLLYFADQKHLVKYGSAITEDSYIAMNYGPVPSLAYDILKSLRDSKPVDTIYGDVGSCFEILDKSIVHAKKEPDLDYLSVSEMACIDEAIDECKSLSFGGRTGKSHDKAWKATKRHGEMRLLDIASAAGAKKGMIAYIQESLENEKASFE